MASIIARILQQEHVDSMYHTGQSVSMLLLLLLSQYTTPGGRSVYPLLLLALLQLLSLPLVRL